MIPYGRQNILPSDIEAVVEALQADFLTTGPSVARFEETLCAQTGARYAVACSSGTAALHLACLALDIGDGDWGVTSSNTFLASANCLEYCGGKADFADIDPETLCLSLNSLKQLLAKGLKPKVVIPVDFAGVPFDLPALHQLAKEHRFSIISDCAHSLGSTYSASGKTFQSGSCAHSDLAIFSFHPVKSITTIEGGAVLTNDPTLAERLRLFRSHGMTKDPRVLTKNDGPWYYEMHAPGFHYRLTDVQCALGTAQMKRLADIKAERQRIVRIYTAAFQADDRLISPPWPAHTSPCFHLYALQFRAGEQVRKRVYDHLLAKGIQSQVHYIPVHTQPYYRNKYGYSSGKCPEAELYYSRCLSLPLYHGLKEEEVQHVITSVLEAL